MNRSKRYALFLFKIFFAQNIHDSILVFSVNCPQLLPSLCMGCRRGGTWILTGAVALWENYMLLPLSKKNYNISCFFGLKYVSNRILTCGVKDGNSSALYCSQTGVHTDAVHSFRLQLRETVTAASSIYYLLLSLFIWAQTYRVNNKWPFLQVFHDALWWFISELVPLRAWMTMR